MQLVIDEACGTVPILNESLIDEVKTIHGELYIATHY